MARTDFETGNARGVARIGIAGWKYEPWRKLFYPEGLAQKNELAYASRALPTIEINSTFYRLQRPSVFASWYAQTPDGFCFSVKAPKRITHDQRLRDITTPLANFFASGVLELGEKLGPVLWQLPPSFKLNLDLLDDFLSRLPHDTEAAAALARQHASDFKDTSEVTGTKRLVRHAMEVRHSSFADPAFIDLLRRHKVAFVIADTGGRWPEFEDLCADFVYIRLHGNADEYAQGYTEAALDEWAKRIRAWLGGHQADGARLISSHNPPAVRRDVFCYFDNSFKERAPDNARRLLEKLGAS